MKSFRNVLLLLGVLCAALFIAGFQSSDKIERKQMRDMLVQLGYEVKDLDTTVGKEKFSFTLERGGLNIPVAAEISPNGNYIWLTVFLKQGLPDGEKAVGLLKKNADIQPSQFYITKSNKVMMALGIENRGVTNAMLRNRCEKIVDDVVNNKEAWQ